MAQAVADAFSTAWNKHAKCSRIAPQSKPWWDWGCDNAFNNYKADCSAVNWKKFRANTRHAKRVFFDECIKKITESNKHPWDLMNWIQQCKNLLCKAIQYNREPYHDMPQLWDNLHGTYNSASGHDCDTSILDELP